MEKKPKAPTKRSLKDEQELEREERAQKHNAYASFDCERSSRPEEKSIQQWSRRSAACHQGMMFRLD